MHRFPNNLEPVNRLSGIVEDFHLPNGVGCEIACYIADDIDKDGDGLLVGRMHVCVNCVTANETRRLT
jgi:hypothetical protein